jgi:hypothetical protein
MTTIVDRPNDGDAGSRQGSPDERPEDDRTPILKVVGAVSGSTALIVALLIYFGWARTQAYFGYFGVPADIVAYSTEQYVLRSARPMFVIFFVIIGIVVSAEVVKVAIGSRLASVSRHLTTAADLLAVGLLVFAILVAVNLVGLEPRPVLVPAALLAAAIMLRFSTGLGLASGGMFSQSRLLRAASTLVVLVLLFKLVGNYAVYHGESTAETNSRNPSILHSVAIESATALQLDPKHVTRETVDRGGSTGYRYSGLHLLAVGKDRYFFLPRNWKSSTVPVVALSRSADVTLEFLP